MGFVTFPGQRKVTFITPPLPFLPLQLGSSQGGGGGIEAASLPADRVSLQCHFCNQKSEGGSRDNIDPGRWRGAALKNNDYNYAYLESRHQEMEGKGAFWF